MDGKLLIAAGIVTYNPDIKRLENTVDRILKETDLLFIADNGSDSVEEIRRICKGRAHLLAFPENRGIACALNAIMKGAKAKGASWVLTLDDDSDLPDGMIEALFSCTKEADVAIVCPRAFDVNAGEEVKAAFHETEGEIAEVDQCITSGALTSVEAWERVGGYDDYLFIDMVDFDFCHLVREAGYRILKNNRVTLPHAIGRTEVRRFLFMKVHVMNHSAMRKYYMTRNRIYCAYKHTGRMGFRNLFGIIKALVLILCYETNKRAKIAAVLRGLRDGIRARRRVL